MNNFDNSEAEKLRNTLTTNYRTRVRWKPSDKDLERIEEFGYLGIYDPREHASLLGVRIEEYTLAGVCVPSIIDALNRGKAKAHFDVQSTLMGMVRGTIESNPSLLMAVKFTLSTRFGSDERAAQTAVQVAQVEARLRLERQKVKLSKKKLDLDTKAHEDKLELEITKFARDLTPQEREAMAK